MSLEQTQRELGQVDKDIAELNKKMADCVKKESDKNKRIIDTQKSINKNTSKTTVQSKLRQIQTLESEKAKILTDKAAINKKIAEKSSKRVTLFARLNKEQSDLDKKNIKAQKSMQAQYDRSILELTSQIQNSIPNISTNNNLYTQIPSDEYDVFISHASEDKEAFANELTTILSDEYGFKVWYDVLNISWGDSLRSQIDNGLKKSKFGIVVISKFYINKGWTQYELDGLFQKEMTDGKTILPIWHNITKSEVQAFSPTLAGRKALNTSMFTTREIAEELKKLFPSLDKNDEETTDASQTHSSQQIVT